MNDIKITHFRRDNSGKKFPAYRTLSSPDMEIIRETLRNSLSLDDKISDLELTVIVDGMQTAISQFNALKEDFILIDVFEECSIKPSNYVYINWHRYDDIDEMNVNDLIEYFDDIWYPDSDDIDIFDSTLSWIVSVSHNGSIKFLKKNKP